MDNKYIIAKYMLVDDGFVASYFTEFNNVFGEYLFDLDIAKSKLLEYEEANKIKFIIIKKCIESGRFSLDERGYLIGFTRGGVKMTTQYTIIKHRN